MIYLDFAKAFDKVDHGILLRKLVDLGIDAGLIRWVKSFLTNRKQKVEVDGKHSREAEVVSGVPQGSVLGPLLFLVHIGDIDENVTSARISSFADDTRIMKQVKSVSDCDDLQRDLSMVYKWVQSNNMTLNDEKFEALRYGEHPVRHIVYKTERGLDIAQKESVRDLGVLVQNNARFVEHIATTVRKCHRQIGWVLRTFQTREPLPMLILYKALVVPIAEYCCQLWNPMAIGEITKLEGVQRTFTSRIAGLQDFNYWQRLDKLNLYSLQRRRERYIIIYVWKILTGLAPNFEREDLGIKAQGEGTRLGRKCLLPPLVRTREGTIRDQSFSVMGPRLFNAIPVALREFDGSLSTFKSKLDGFLGGVEDKPPLPGYYDAAGGNSITQQLAHVRAQQH